VTGSCRPFTHLAARVSAALGMATVALAMTAARGEPAGPTRIERVDALVDAPYALFGRTRAELEARLGPPAGVRRRSVSLAGDRPTTAVLEELAYPGLVVEVSESRIRRVQMTAPGHALPFGVAPGTPRGDIEEILGEAQETTDALALYLYSDAYPDTVIFHFRDGRVYRIEWTYWVPGIPAGAD
jgi:hypothetical protein